jgi:hypothetical protein
MTCVANKWVPSLDPSWECGEGKWYKEKKECPQPAQDPDAGLCYHVACKHHSCVQTAVKCKKTKD